MLTEGQTVFYLAPNGRIYECIIDIIVEKKAHIKSIKGDFEATISVHETRCFETLKEAERFLYI